MRWVAEQFLDAFVARSRKLQLRSLIMRAVRPLAIAMQAINDVCRRLILPGLIPESVLETTDLERAIELSETDSKMIDLERRSKTMPYVHRVVR